MTCPFSVGDRIRSKPMTIFYGDGKPIQMLGSVWPEATVTAVRETEFDFRYDEPFVVNARLNIVSSGGTCYEAGFSTYELVP